MKKILLISIVLAAAVSCLDSGSFSTSYTSYLHLEAGSTSVLYASDSLWFDKDGKKGIGFPDNGYGFVAMNFYHNLNGEATAVEGGFVWSGLKMPESGDVNSLVNNEYRANVKLKQDNAYLVFLQSDNMPEKNMEMVYNDFYRTSCTPVSVEVSNTAAVEEAVRSQFVAGDELKLRAKGRLDGKETGIAEFILAKYSSEKDSIVSTWTAFDLSKLSAVDEIHFEIIAPSGKDIPKTVCLDNIVTSISVAAE